MYIAYIHLYVYSVYTFICIAYIVHTYVYTALYSPAVHVNSYALRGVPIRYTPPFFLPDQLTLPVSWTLPSLPSDDLFRVRRSHCWVGRHMLSLSLSLYATLYYANVLLSVTNVL